MSSKGLLDEKVFRRLHAQIERGKHATTYLFTGDELDKKKALAIAFAKALNCERSLRGGRKADEAIYDIACTCESCRQIEAGTHPDVKWYGLDEEAASIKIEEVRDFKNWLSYKPYKGKVKVFIFNRAERLTAEAQNALLKSLEEPPPGNVILLLVPHRKFLFDTIGSRATEIKVPPFRAEEIRDLFTKEGVDRNQAEYLARISRGELGRARLGLEEKWFEQKNEWLDQLLKNPISFLDEFQQVKRDEAARLFDFLIEAAHDLLILKAKGDRELLIHAHRAGALDLIAQKRALDSLIELFESMTEAKAALDDYANIKLSLTHAGMIWNHLLGTVLAKSLDDSKLRENRP